jgi:hypothetical protein
MAKYAEFISSNQGEISVAYTSPNRRRVFGQYAAISGPLGGIIVGEDRQHLHGALFKHV